ncbi:MAG: hypothetical protein JWP35_90 [Caulobacter sp.]|nr:hypothetical protein [Caulobacter sp.]
MLHITSTPSGPITFGNGDKHVARKPNYKFERQERDRAKAAKKASRAAERAAEGLPPEADAPDEEAAEGDAAPDDAAQ